MEPRIGEVKRLIANVTKAQKLLGWESKYNFEKGLKEFVQWYRNYGLEESLKLE
jgi:nucleoside-diphosphate-sugar epimerase